MTTGARIAMTMEILNTTAKNDYVVVTGTVTDVVSDLGQIIVHFIEDETQQHSCCYFDQCEIIPEGDNMR